VILQPEPSGDKSLFQRCCPCLTIEFFQQYFDVTTDDIKQRLLLSLVPFNGRFHTAYQAKPDLYGPFWIYTTLIIMLAIAGNLYRYFQLGDDFTYNYNFVPVAATVIYSIGLGLPLGLKLLMQFLGSRFFNGTYIEVRT
jgi:protein YIPF1/2